MPGGTEALAVLLCLLPGWVYWRFEGRPRTERSSLGELFEVAGAGAVSSGVTVLAYVTIANHWDIPLTEPSELTRRYVSDNLAKTSWSIAVVLTVACALGALAANIQRHSRRWRTGERSTYLPETPLWVSALGGKPETVVTVEMRDGRKISGYLEGYEIDVEGPPSMWLAPPLSVEHPPPRTVLRRRVDAEPDDFGEHRITIPGCEIVAVWAPYAPRSGA